MPVLKKLFLNFTIAASVLTAVSITATAQTGNASLDLEAMEKYHSIGAREFGRITYSELSMPALDCYRIWAGRTPMGNFVTPNKVNMPLTRGICDAWAEDISLHFESFGLDVPAKLIKSKKLRTELKSARMGTLYDKDYGARKSWRESLPEGQKACGEVPRTPQQFLPEYDILREVVIKRFIGSYRTNDYRFGGKCVPYPDSLYKMNGVTSTPTASKKPKSMLGMFQ